ncbi:MAG: hypothetical protein NZ455_11095 [Bacteroidia bacterium]|nr:hypothetical protein [Bacteroidia bacterium]
MRLGAKPPSPTFKPLPKGWGVAPLARSTPTRSASEGTRPKNFKDLTLHLTQLYFKRTFEIKRELYIFV